MNKKRIAALLMGVGLIAAACSSSSDSAASTTTTGVAETPATAPAAVTVEDQMSDGMTIVVKSVELPSAGFIAVHADNGGSPGAVIGHSDLLPAGTSDDVAVTLDTPLEGTSIVWPMVHIDMDGDGQYTFMPPDNAIDLPALFDNGDVAVVAVNLMVLPATTPSSLQADEQTSDGTTVVVTAVNLPSAGFIAVHADAEGSPGPVIGHSDLLPAGENADVTVTLDEALTASGVVWPMVHIDMDGDGEYTFMPPANAVDVPGITEDGNVAVIPVQINL
jgi:hypothetical protein